jgi:mannose-6-phosphate isomerase-like protein (cupin superfamily)
MNIRNFLNTTPKELKNCHDGVGTLPNVTLFEDRDFEANIRFLNYTVLPPDTSIGEHKHGNDQELYIILEGQGLMTTDGETKEVRAGDVIVNRPFGTHGLVNNGEENLRILVLEVYK